MDKMVMTSIKALKVALKDYGFTREQQQGVEFALQKMRELAAADDEKAALIDKVSNLYQPAFVKDDNDVLMFERIAYNSAIRDVLDILDPNKERYNRKEG